LDPRETAIDLLWILHKAGLCRSGSVDVRISPSGVVSVKGAVDTAEQLTDLKIRLGEARGAFSFEVRAASDQPPTSQLFETPAPSKPAKTPASDALIASWLKTQHVGADRATAESLRISNRLVELANDAWVESWAIRHLRDQFGPAVSGDRRLAEMAHAHLITLLKVLTEERDILAPMLEDVPTSNAEAGPVTIADVARLSQMIQDTFAGASQNLSDLRSLLEALSKTAPTWTAQ
jgi:hypothetical protein